MTVSATLLGVLLHGVASSRPAASAVAGGTVYSATDTGAITQSDGSSWSTFATISSGLADPMTTRGDLIYRNASNVTARLPIGSSGKVLSSDGTDVSWQTAAGAFTAAGCRVTNSGNVAIGSSSVTVVTWDTETWDTDAYHSLVTNTGRMTVPSGKDGKYLLVAELQWASSASGLRWAAFYKSGTLYQVVPMVPNTGVAAGFDSATPQGGSAMAVAVATDYFEVRVFQDTGGSLNISGTIDGGSSFSIAYLGA
jgi:hypothetical protein